jgi:BASS family bile acid:Na+ symporter
MMLVVKYTVMTSVILLMLGVGLRITFRQVLEVFRQVASVARGLAANFLVVPVLTYLTLVWLPIAPDVKIGIMLMAAVPIAPMAPSPFVDMADGDLPYSAGLMTIVAILSVALTPLILFLALPRSEGGMVLDPLQIIEALLTVQLIPIGVGMALASASPSWTARLLRFVPKLGQIGLLLGVAALLVVQASEILAIGLVGYAAIAVLVIVWLFAGDWMGYGEAPARRRSLAILTAIRNIPLAFLIANASFPGSAVAAVTLFVSALTMVASVIYAKVLTGRSSPASEA